MLNSDGYSESHGRLAVNYATFGTRHQIPCTSWLRTLLTLNSTKALLAAGSVALLAACAGSGQSVVGGVGGNFENVTMRPGGSVSCVYSPCRVFFDMPAGAGVYAVTMNKQNVGEYPAGETVLLGSFYSGSYVIRVLDTNAPLAYLGIDHE